MISTPIHTLLQTSDTPLGKLINQARAIEELNQAFVQILEPDLIPHCRVGCYEAGILTLFCESAAYATKLRFHVPTLLSKLRGIKMWAGLASIQIKVQTHRIAPLDLKNEKEKEVLHLSEKTVAQLLTLAESLKNQTGSESLVASLERLAQHR
ncbi:MAG: DUF721 domain-containing protein [Candidatus Berkiellales bacterium]